MNKEADRPVLHSPIHVKVSFSRSKEVTTLIWLS